MRTSARELETPRQVSSPQAPARRSFATGGGMGSALRLQRTIGNRALQRLLAAQARKPGVSARPATLHSSELFGLVGAGGMLQRDGDDGSVGDSTTDTSTPTSIMSNDTSQVTSDGGQSPPDAGAPGGCQVRIYSGTACKPETQTNSCPAGQCCAGPANHFAIGDAGAITSYKGSCSGPKLETRPSNPDVPCAWFYKDGGSEFLFSAMIDCPIAVS